MSKRTLIYVQRSHYSIARTGQCNNINIGRLSLIVLVNVVLNRTVVVDSDLVSTTCAVVMFRVKVSCITSVDGIILC